MGNSCLKACGFHVATKGVCPHLTHQASVPPLEDHQCLWTDPHFSPYPTRKTTKAIFCLSGVLWMNRSSPSKLDRDGGLCKILEVGNSSVGLENIRGRGLMGCKLQGDM